MKEVKELLGLKNNNVKVLSVEEKAIDNEKIQFITLKGTINKLKCPKCGKYTKSIHDKLKPITVKYNKVVDRKCYLILYKRRFICRQCNERITEDLGLNLTRKTVSKSLEIKIRKDLLKPNFTIKQIAEDNDVSQDKVRNILKDVMSDYPDYLTTLPQVISFDEFKADTSYGKYAFIINDPIKKRTLDILPNRRKDYLISYFTHVENRENVKYVISDMYEPYLLVTKVMFKNAKYAVDRFHYVTYIMDALDDIRIRLQKTYGYNSKEYKLLKNKKNVSLLRKYYNEVNWYVLTKRYEKGRYVYKLPIDILHQLLNINDELDRGYQLKELFLDIVHHDYSLKQVEIELNSWIDLCKESKIEEFIDASKTIENWLPYIINSFIDKRFTNEYTEGLNNKIKVIKRNAYGYKNFEFFRLRLMYILNGILSGRSKKNNNKKLQNNTN